MLWKKENIRGIPKRDVLDEAVLTTFISNMKKERYNDKFADNAVTLGVRH